MARNKEFTISVALRAVDKLSQPMAKMNLAFSQMSKTLRRAQATSALSPLSKFSTEARGCFRSMAELSGSMGLTRVLQDTKIIGGKLGQVFGSIKNAFGGFVSFFMKGSILLGIAGFSFYEALGGYIRRTEGLDRVSKAFGMSSEAMRGWGFAAEAAGVEAEGFHKVLRKLATSQALAHWGVPNETLSLYNLGIKSLTQGEKLKGLDSLLFEVSKRVSNPNLDQQKKLALLKPIFGRQAYDALAMLGAGPQALKTRITEMRAISFTPDEEAKKRGTALRYAQLRAKAAFTGMSDTIMNELAPGLEKFFNQFTQFWKDNRKEITLWAQTFSQKLPGAWDALKDILSTVSACFRPIFSAMSFLVRTFGAGNTALGLFLSYFSIKNFSSILTLSKSLWNLGKNIKLLYSSGRLVGIFDSLLGVFLALAPEIVGLTALAGLGYLVYKNWNQVEKLFQSISKTIGILEKKPIFNILIPAMKDALGAFRTVGGWLTPDLSTERDDPETNKNEDIFPTRNSSPARISDEIDHLIQNPDRESKVSPNHEVSEYFKAIRNPTQKSNEPLGQITIEFINTPAGTRISHQDRRISFHVKQGRSFLEVPS